MHSNPCKWVKLIQKHLRMLCVRLLHYATHHHGSSPGHLVGQPEVAGVPQGPEAGQEGGEGAGLEGESLRTATRSTVEFQQYCHQRKLWVSGRGGEGRGGEGRGGEGRGGEGGRGVEVRGGLATWNLAAVAATYHHLLAVLSGV